MRAVAVGLTATVVVALLGGLTLQLRTIAASVEVSAAKDLHHVERVLEEKYADALALATLIAQDPTLQAPFAARDRPALLDRFEEPFEELQRDHGVTHLHFAVPPATSLLRVHAPDTFGDDLTDYRPMLAEAVARGQALAGFERGRFGTSARAVVPVRSDQRAADSWQRTGQEPTRVLGVVDLGFSLDDTLLADSLTGSEVAVITLPSPAVAATLDRDDPVAVSSTLAADIELAVEDTTAAQALVDGELERLVPHDTRRWQLSRVVLEDHLGSPAAVLLIASDIQDATTSSLIAVLVTVLMLAVLLVVAGVLLLVRQTGDHLSGVRAQVESARQAGTDPLTGVANRRSFDVTVAGRLPQGRPYAVLYADLDHFKQLNDTHGHDVGDRALRLFAGVLKSSLRPDDVVARFGGEEFVVLVDGCDAEQAHDAADAALLRAKDTGRDRVVLHEVPAAVSAP